MTHLDEFERDILKSVENGEWQSKSNITKHSWELQSIIKHQKRKAISIKISENDLYELKKKSLESSIPHQNLIQMLIYQFTSDKTRLSI
jgi:predicted DNA binding CopG/RHH family protein